MFVLDNPQRTGATLFLVFVLTVTMERDLHIEICSAGQKDLLLIVFVYSQPLCVAWKRPHLPNMRVHGAIVLLCSVKLLLFVDKI